MARGGDLGSCLGCNCVPELPPAIGTAPATCLQPTPAPCWGLLLPTTDPTGWEKAPRCPWPFHVGVSIHAGGHGGQGAARAGGKAPPVGAQGLGAGPEGSRAAGPFPHPLVPRGCTSPLTFPGCLMWAKPRTGALPPLPPPPPAFISLTTRPREKINVARARQRQRAGKQLASKEA